MTKASIEALNKAARYHKVHGNYKKYCEFRRAYLNAQAREYERVKKAERTTSK